MEISGQSSFSPADNMENGYQETLAQSCKDYTTSGHSSLNGCCRLCLKGNCHLQKLFPGGGYTEDLLINKILECTTVEITFANDPDALICYSCVAKTEEFHRYREQCRSNDVQYKNSLRRAESQIHAASTSSALLPAKYIKKEIDSEGFEISAADFFPTDTTEQSSYGGAYETSFDAPIASVADSSCAVDSTIPNESGILNGSEDDDDNENLLELMPERTHDGYTISYTTLNDEYDNNNEVVCELPIKEEPQDFDDNTGGWNDFGMEDDGTMDHSASLVPLIEDCSYSSDTEPETDVQQPYREVYNDTGLVCIMQDGFLYVQNSNGQWKCRVKDCAAEVIRYANSDELETNGITHVHSKEVKNTASDGEILRLVEQATTAESSRESDDDSFHYVRNIRHGSSIVYKGYKYSMKHTKVDGTTYWKCRSGSCSAALYKTANNKFTTVGVHTHGKQIPHSTPNSVQPSYVTSVSTDGEGSPPKIKLKIARQTDASALQYDPETSPKDEMKSANHTPTPKVVKRGYGHKIVKNANGRTRLYFDGNMYVWESSRNEKCGKVVLWRCRRNYDMCGVKALQYEDGLVEILGEHDHASIKKTLKIPDNVTGTTAYEMFPTAKGGETMVLDGYRYVKAYFRTNGMSLWRCVGFAGVTCRVRVTMATDGLAYVPRNVMHSHGRPQNVKKKVSHNAENSDIKLRAIKTDENLEKKVYRTRSAESESGTLLTMCKTDKTQVVRKAYGKGPAASAPVNKTVKATSKSQPVRNYRVIRNKKGNKALVHAGYRYCKIRTRQDGSISWLCKMNKKTCRVPVYQHPDGRLEWTSHRRHNHSPTDPIEPPKKTSQLPLTAPPTPRGNNTSYHIDDETFVNHEWFFVRNQKNGTTLVHAGYRYHKKGKRVNDTSIWRCAQVNQGCRATIVLHPDETIAKSDDIDHNHPPHNTAIEEMEVIVGNPDESSEQHQNESSSSIGNDTTELSLVQFNGCIEEQDDPEANMRSLLSTMLDVSDESTNKSVGKIVIPAAKAQVKYVTNRRHTKSLVFKGYRYARSSIAVRADGSVRWTCQMNKKTCRVSVRVLKDGSVEMDDQKHNHEQLPEDRDTNAADDDADVDERNDSYDDETNHADDSDNGDEAHDHYFALNRSNGRSLIFQRNRYSKDNVRPDGSILWRCMMRNDCLAKVILLRDNTCVPYRHTAHNHSPLDVLPKPLQYPERRVDSKLVVKGDMLIYKQNRMKKTKSFSDGTAIFKCTEAHGCTGIVKIRYEETDAGASSPVVIFDSAHTHPNVLANADGFIDSSTTKAAGGKSKRKSPVKMLKYSPTGTVDNYKEYQLFKNDRGQVSLVYKGYRFSLRNQNANGDSSWKCRANKTCTAYVSFTEDGHVIHDTARGGPKGMPHNHPINGEYIERAVPLELDQLHPPAHNLSEFVSNWIKGFYKNELGGKAKTSPKSAHHNIERKNTIYHKNYSYKLQTTKNGREFWRCTMFEARACRAGLFCINNGTILQYDNGREHNHEAAKPSTTSAVHQAGQSKGKSNDGGCSSFSTLNEVQKSIKRSQSTLPFDEQQFADESVPASPYKIVKRDGIDTLLYERHRYAVSCSKQEEATAGEPKRWRCCLWNSRHQCPVELTILPTDEIHFVTDPTHNHRPPPPESQESLDRHSALSVKGTKKYEVTGRFKKNVFYKGHQFCWKEERNGSTYYRCLCYATHDCAVTVKIDPNGLLYECSTASHNHSPVLDTSADSGALPTKPMSGRNIASRQTRLADCPKTGSSDYRFVRSCLGNSMVFEGHRYWLHSKLSCGLYVYRCRYQKQKDCTGSVYMDVDTRLMYHRYDAEHNHEPLEQDAVAGIEQDDAENTSDLTKLDNSNLVENFDNSKLDSSSNKPHTAVVPKKEVSITTDYSFVKDSLDKNQLFYKQYVYEIVPPQYRKNGDKCYSCLYSGCSAAVKLLASGGLDISTPVHHDHEQPDLTDYRNVGIGSTDFLTLSPSGSGAKPTILFEGYQYCATVASAASQPLHDDTKLFYCLEKNRGAERCLASLEMLPNGRVIVNGTHHHPKPNQTDTDGSSETAQPKTIFLGERSYVYVAAQLDGTTLWQCNDDPKCMAKVYKKTNGKLIFGPIKHVLRHAKTKLLSHASSHSAAMKAKSAVQTVPTVSLNSSTSSSGVPPGSTGNLRTKWYKGNRYNFYLTRRDGVQYWRCCKRMELNCEAGIFCYPSGSVTPTNRLPHSHPPLNPSLGKAKQNNGERQQLSQSAELQDETPVFTVKMVDVNKSDSHVPTNHSISKSPDASDMFIWYKGSQYSLRHRHPDGTRIYRCRNKPCTHSLVVTKRGKVISKKTTWHSCERQNSDDSNDAQKTNAFSSNGASAFGFDKPEIEDPDDLVDQSHSNEIQPIVKRIRLSSNNIEMVPENNFETESEAIVQTVNSLPNLDTETDAEREAEPFEEGHGGRLPRDFMDGNGSTSTWGESDFIVHEAAESMDTNDNNSETETDRPMDDGTHDQEAFDESSAPESFGGSLTCQDATNS